MGEPKSLYGTSNSFFKKKSHNNSCFTNNLYLINKISENKKRISKIKANIQEDEINDLTVFID